MQLGSPHLNIVQPGSQVVNASLPIHHVPHHQVERPSGQEALVSDIILLLSAKVPGVEGDAAHGLAGLPLAALVPVQVLAVLPDAQIHTNSRQRVWREESRQHKLLLHHGSLNYYFLVSVRHSFRHGLVALVIYSLPKALT